MAKKRTKISQRYLDIKKVNSSTIEDKNKLKKDLKEYSLEELILREYGPLGTPRRNEFEKRRFKTEFNLRGNRYNEGKIKWSLVDFKSIESLPRVLEFGAKKYSRDQWKKGLDKKEILESSMRHLTAIMDGEENDPESGLPHSGHIYANTMFYEYFDRIDREKKKK